MSSQPLRIGDIVELTAERLAFGGDAVAHHNGLAVFITLGAPGERLSVRITEVRKNFARATIEEILVPSPSRRAAPCKYFGECGGCQLQHIDYAVQRAANVTFIRDALTRIGKLDWPHEIEVVASPEFGYRTRAEVKLERPRGGEAGNIRIGFVHARSHSVCDVEDCPILVPELNSALHLLRSVIGESPQAADVTMHGRGVAEIDLAAGQSGVTVAPHLEGLPGGRISRVVRGAVYDFDAATFFQVNPFLLEALVEEAVGDAGGRSALDLYAGVGLFTVQLARQFESVAGIESDQRAAAFARQNLSSNGIENVEFHSAAVEPALNQIVRSGKSRFRRPDLLVLDPPRSGAAEAVPGILALEPRHVTYVSCDPSTLARDLRQLSASGYRLARVKGFDLFPQTYHVETVAHLERR